MKNKILILLSLLLLSGNAGLCKTSAVYTVATKFLIAMGGVLLSSVLIFLGLHIYNKYFVSHKIDDNPVSSPKTVDEAVKFFINRNKLQ